jgi:DNA-binding transcriptional MerR regulator
MLSIGELAHRTGVSRRMLRHWEESGLLAPAQVDPSSGRREYEPRQAGRVLAIAALRATGFGLNAIRDLLTSELSEDRLIALLRQRERELSELFAEAETRLGEVRSRLASLAKGHDVIMKTLDLSPLAPLRLMAVQERVADESEIGDAVARLLLTLRDSTPVDSDIVLVYDGTTDPSVIAVTVGVPSTPDGMVPDGLREVLVAGTDTGASVSYAEPPESVGDAWITIDSELEKRSLRASGPYLQFLHSDGSTTLAAGVDSAPD